MVFQVSSRAIIVYEPMKTAGPDEVKKLKKKADPWNSGNSPNDQIVSLIQVVSQPWITTP